VIAEAGHKLHELFGTGDIQDVTNCSDADIQFLDVAD
jgi:hypothetical protein